MRLSVWWGCKRYRMFSWGAFIIYSIVFFSYPAALSTLNPLLLGFTLLIAAKCLIKDSSAAKEFRAFQILLLFYGFWIVLSSLVHYYALGLIDPLTYITIDKKNAVWGLQTIKDTASVYLSFPLLFFIAIHICKSYKADYKILYLLPIFIIPSLAVALYQGFIDIKFLNNPYFAELNRVSGLDNDSNGFGLSLFLLSTLCVLAVFMVKDKLKRFLFIILALFLCMGLLLSGSLTGFAGFALFLIIFPWISLWANIDISKRGRMILKLAPLFFGLLTGMVLIIFMMSNASSSPATLKRLNSLHADFKEGGMKNILSRSGRLDLGAQAYRLTKLSMLSGWAPGGELRNLQNIRLRSRSDGFYFLMDNANNHYLQMSSELGLLGASFSIILHLFPLWMFLRVRKNIRDKDQRLADGVVFSTVCIMMLLFITGPHTMAISVQWIFTVLLAFLFVTALKYGYKFNSFNMKLLISFILLTCLFFWGTFNNAFGKEGYEARHDADWWPLKYERNCYEIEQWGNARARWCKGNAVLQFSIYKALPEYVPITISVQHPDTIQKPVTVRYGGKSGAIHEVVFKDSPWITVQIPVTEEYIFEYTFPNGIKVKYFVLSLDVSRTWTPKEWGVSGDTRELGVAVIVPAFLRPS